MGGWVEGLGYLVNGLEEREEADLNGGLSATMLRSLARSA